MTSAVIDCVAGILTETTRGMHLAYHVFGTGLIQLSWDPFLVQNVCHFPFTFAYIPFWTKMPFKSLLIYRDVEALADIFMAVVVISDVGTSYRSKVREHSKLWVRYD